jgi:N6-adenosine-specific RNA methylase IME4
MKQYNIIYADPPWRFKNWSIGERAKRGEKWARRNGRSPYDVMNRDCALFLWATHPKLPDALQVMEGWGFEYKTVAFTWVKQNRGGVGFHFGLGYWTRQNPEICLLGTRGKPKRVDNSVPHLVISPLREHSRKPDEVRRRIVALMGDLPRVELFARQAPDGWDVFGNEVESTVEVAEVLQVAAV